MPMAHLSAQDLADACNFESHFRAGTPCLDLWLLCTASAAASSPVTVVLACWVTGDGEGLGLGCGGEGLGEGDAGFGAVVTPVVKGASTISIAVKKQYRLGACFL
jgi:hypothetical protein